MAIDLKLISREFKTPITVAGVSSTHKEFLEGTIDGFPFELSVLPGLHKETFEQATAQFEQRDHYSAEEFYPSVLFALEAWEFQKKNLQEQAPWNLPVSQNALLLSPNIKEIESARAEDKTCFKIKIGRLESANDLFKICEYLKPHEKLRLDGNRLLNPAQLTALLAPLEPFWGFIDYIEEPFATSAETLSWQHPVALAVDESLPNFINSHLPTTVKAVVLKPSLYGFKRSLKMIDNFNRRGVLVTLSSSFEGPIGLAAISALASYQNSIQPNPAGLDTLRYFN